jgi:hypothetical protein
MIDLSEYFTEEVLDECNIDELKIIVRSMLHKIEYDQQLIHDQLIDKRWYRKIIDEDRHKHSWKEQHYKDKIKSLELELAVAKKMYKKKRNGKLI